MKQSAMIIEAVSTHWALHRPVFNAFAAILARKAKGEEIDPDEVARVVKARDERTAGPVITDSVTFESDDARFEERAKLGYTRVGGVAHIPVGGVIVKHASLVNGMSQPRGTSTERVRMALDNALADDRVKSILLHIESSGGSVMGLSALGDDVFNARATLAARGGEIVTYFDDIGASAAYWIGSQASRVLAGPAAEIGSIGVYTLVADSTEFWKNEGYTLHLVKAGVKKGIGAEGQRVSVEDLGVVQQNIDDLYTAFKSAVARGRGLSAEQVDALATGEVWIAEKAKARGLVDDIASSADAVIAQMNERLQSGQSKGGGNGTTAGRASSGHKATAEGERTGQSLVTAAAQQAASAAVTGAQRQESVHMRWTKELLNAAGTDGGTGSAGSGGGGGGGSSAVDTKPKAQEAVDVTKVTQDAVNAERARVADITAKAELYPNSKGVQDLKVKAIAEGWSADKFVSESFTVLAKENGPTGHATAAGQGQGLGGFELRLTRDERDTKADAIALAMVGRYNPSVVASLDKPKSDFSNGGEVVARALGFDSPSKAKAAVESATRYATGTYGRVSLMAVAATCIAASMGISVADVHSRFNGEIAFMQAVNTRGDFPLLMARYANMSLLPQFNEIPTMFQDICAIESASDFKDATLVAFSEAPSLELVVGTSTPRRGNFNERGETLLGVETYARTFGIDYKAIRDDSLGAFNRLTQAFVMAARRVPDDLLKAQLAQNSGDGPTLSDNLPLYSTNAKRLNKFTASAISYANIKADYLAASERKGFGVDAVPIEVTPDRVLLPYSISMAMDEILKAQYEPGKANMEPNLMRGMLRTLPWKRLTGTRRYYFAAPSPYAVFVARFLDGQQTPLIQQINQPNPRTIEWDISIPGVAIGCTGQHEATATNPGA